MHMTTQSKFCVFVILYLVYSAGQHAPGHNTDFLLQESVQPPPLKHIQNLK